MKESRVYIETSEGHKMVLEPYQVVEVWEELICDYAEVNAMTLIVDDIILLRDQMETVITLIEYLDEK